MQIGRAGRIVRDRCVAVVAREQPVAAAADDAREIEALAHLARAGPARRIQRPAIGRDAAVQRLAHLAQPVHQRHGVGNRLAVVGQAHRGNQEAHRVLELVPAHGAGVLRQEHRAQHRRNVAVAALEGLRHRVDQGGRGLVVDEVFGELPRDEARAGGLAHDPFHRLLVLGVAAALDGLAEEGLVAEIVPVGIELEQAVAHEAGAHAAEAAAAHRQLRRQQAGAGKHAHQLLHVGLRVARAHAERVQLHQLARVVLVGLVLDVVHVVEEHQHGRALQRGHHQVLELAQRARADHLFLVVGGEHAHGALVRVDAEVVEPEPHHLFLELVAAIHRMQQLGLRGLLVDVAAVLLVRLLRGVLGRAGRRVLELLLAVAEVRQQFGQWRAHHGKAADLRGHLRRQRVVATGQLLIEEARAAEFAVARQRGAVQAEAVATQPGDVRKTQAIHLRGDGGGGHALLRGLSGAGQRRQASEQQAQREAAATYRNDRHAFLLRRECRGINAKGIGADDCHAVTCRANSMAIHFSQHLARPVGRSGYHARH